MKKVILAIIIIIEALIIIAVPEHIIVQFVLLFPFLFIYFIYRLIKGLMKYHHDLKQEDKEK